MSMLLDRPRTCGDAVAAAADAFLAECAAFDLNDQSVPELDVMLAVADRMASFTQGWRTRVRAQHAKLLEAGRPTPSPGSKPEPAPKPLPRPLPRPGRSNAEQARDDAAARAVGWAPSFGTALEAGEISMDHVIALSRVRHHQCVPRHETALLCVAKMRTAEDFAKHCTTWDAERNHDNGIDRTASLRAKRKVSFFDRDGLHAMFAALPALDATHVENTLREIANELFHESADDATTLTQRLADALVVMADRATGRAQTTKSNRPTLVVICHEETLRGRVDDAGLGSTLDGTPVPATELRRLACDANIVPAVMNSAGQILDWGRSKRLATDTQRLALLSTYGGCIIDGCACPTQLLDIHHLTPHDHGGPTDLANLAPMCKTHHTRSHTEHWTHTRGPDARITITTPNHTDIPTRRPRRPSSRTARCEPSDRPPDVPSRRAAPHAPPGSLFDLAVSG